MANSLKKKRKGTKIKQEGGKLRKKEKEHLNRQEYARKLLKQNLIHTKIQNTKILIRYLNVFSPSFPLSSTLKEIV